MILIDGKKTEPYGLRIALDIKNNGLQRTLSKPTFQKDIAKTIIGRTSGGVKKAIWLDKLDRVVVDEFLFRNDDTVPVIGELIEEDFKVVY